MPRAKQSKRLPITVERALGVVGLALHGVSPDGGLVAFSQSVLRPEEKTRGNSIWAVDVTDGAARQLTRGPEDAQACWSPDGRMLAFARKLEGDKPPQIMLLPRAGGEAAQLGELEMAPGALTFVPNGKRLSFLAARPDDRATRDRKARGDDARRLLTDDKPQQLWSIGLDAGKARCESPEGLAVWEYGWLPDGRSAVIVYTDDPSVDAQLFRPRLALLRPRTGELTPLATDLQFPRSPRVSQDGRSVAVLGSQTAAPLGGMLFAIDLQSGQVTCLTPDLAGTVEFYEWLPDSSGLLVLVGQGFDSTLCLAELPAAGELKVLSAERPRSVDGFAVAPDGRQAFVICEGPGGPPELWSVELDAPAARCLTRINAATARWSFGRSEVIRWRSDGGLEIEGLVIYPPGYRAGRTYPTILCIHGGPCGRFRHDLGLYPQQVLAQEGYVVLAPNPRGSTGYGETFVKANMADWGGGDFRDLMAGLDLLVKQGVADPDRLGVWGASYGGYMTAWAVTQTDRFRAAVCQCGLTNLFSFNGQADIPSFEEFYFGANPYDDPERFRARSAMTYIRQVKTPTLLLHGEQDARVPIAQSYEMYRGLQHVGVETEFVIYPREGHGISEIPHQRDLYRRALGWFRQHLGAGASPRKEARR